MTTSKEQQINSKSFNNIIIKEANKHSVRPFTFFLGILLVLILASGSLLIYSIVKKNNTVSTVKTQPKIADSSTNIQGISSQELATLENKDSRYTVQYPTNFDAVYTQDGVEFTPKQGSGKIILQVKDQIADVNIQQDKAEQSQLAILNNAAQTIKNTFKFIQPTPINEASNAGRFANVHFDPKKY